MFVVDAPSDVILVAPRTDLSPLFSVSDDSTDLFTDEDDSALFTEADFVFVVSAAGLFVLAVFLLEDALVLVFAVVCAEPLRSSILEAPRTALSPSAAVAEAVSVILSDADELLAA